MPIAQHGTVPTPALPSPAMTQTASPRPRWLSVTWRLSAWVALVLTMLAVFSLYLRPDFLMGMADQLWACF